MRTITNILAAAAIIFLIGFMLSRESTFVPPALPTYVEDTGFVLVSHSELGPIQWFDNERLAFYWDTRFADAAVQKNGLTTTCESPICRTIWNTRTREISATPSGPTIKHCVSIEENRSYFKPAFSNTEMIGVPGQEVERSETIDKSPNRMILSPFQCEFYPIHPKAKSIFSQALLPGDGYLSYWDNKLWHHTDEEAEGRLLPMNEDDAQSDCATYVAYKGAYFLADCSSREGTFIVKNKKFVSRADPDCRAVWWFWPREFRWQKVCIKPYLHSSHITPTKLGFALVRLKHDASGNPLDSGIYLQIGGDASHVGRVVKLVDGWTNGPIAVTPDGCRIAFATAWHMDHIASKVNGKTVTLKTIDVCKHADTIAALPTADLSKDGPMPPPEPLHPAMLNPSLLD